MVARAAKQSSSFILILIGLFKLVKALLLIAVGIGSIRFLHKDLGSTVMHWIQVLRVDPDNRFIHGILVKIFRVTPKQLKELSVGTFLYAGGVLDRRHRPAAAQALGGIFHHHFNRLVHSARDLRIGSAFYDRQTGGHSDQRSDRLVPGGARAVALEKDFPSSVDSASVRRSTIL